MASILQSNFESGFRLAPLQESSGLSESLFQTLYAFVCERVDTLRHFPLDITSQRALPRKKVALCAECSGTWGDSRCLISDFGEGGLALVCGHPNQVGDVIRVRWHFGEQRRIIESLRAACELPPGLAA